MRKKSTQPKVYSIYALIHPVTKIVRYIGYTTKPFEERLRYHYYELVKNRTSHKLRWLRQLREEGLMANIIPLEQGIATLSEALDREVFHISQYSNLVNSTSGGETNKVFDEDVKRRIGATMKGKLVGALNPMFGKKREDLRQRNLNNNCAKNKETIAKIAATLKEKYNTPEYKLIHRNTQTTCKPVNRLNFDGTIVKTYPSIAAAKEDGFSFKEISRVCQGRHRQHKGFKWEYVNN